MSILKGQKLLMKDDQMKTFYVELDKRKGFYMKAYSSNQVYDMFKDFYVIYEIKSVE